MSYFKHFPTTIYNNYELADITRRIEISKIVKDSALDYMSYTVEEGERPEDVAYFYYDDPGFAWLVLTANDIIDPYTQWPKSQDNLEKYIIAQYEKASGKKGKEVIDWARNETIASNIVRYQSLLDPEVSINRASFVALGNTHIVTLENAVIGESYTIKELGDVSNSDWNTAGGTSGQNYSVGSSIQIVNNPASILKSQTARVELPNETNPAREYYPVRAYDYEFNLNEERREIVLVNKGYLSQVKEQIETILKDE
jgi:hypothetical protein